jgi:exopolyphosphatase/guanosine-5'-triphosphate,3'-diphosphate pyrophosphatase
LICACIDIGSNTTRLLVADAEDGRLRELVTQRAFTRIGKSLGHNGGSIPSEKIAETAEVVRTQSTVAREVGAKEIIAVATAAIRQAANREDLVAAVEDAGGVPLGCCPMRRRPGFRSWARPEPSYDRRKGRSP